MSNTRFILRSTLTSAAALCLSISLQGLATANILTDPGWNTPLTNPMTAHSNVLGPPYIQDTWGEETSTVVAAQGGITPFEGNGMLRMDDDGLTVTQVWQRVSVNAFGLQIDNGQAVADLSAWFNVPAGLTGAASRVIIGFYDASNVSTGPQAVVTEGSIGGLDADPNSWQLINNLGVTIPALTRILEAQFSYVNSTMQGQPGYVDAADLDIRVIPEPASCVFFTAGALGLFLRRRR